MCTTKPRQTGFSLIELIFFIVVVSVGLTGILLVMDVSVKSSADPMVRKQTVAAAESLLEEILLKEYTNPVGGFTGLTPRSQFDDVDDYAPYTTAGGMVDITGTAIPGLAQYNVTSVAVTTPPAINGVTLKRVAVTVNGPGGDITLIGYRANY
jgi:MSHA pilin protein MshD